MGRRGLQPRRFPVTKSFHSIHWIPQLPEVECKAKTKKELLNMLAIRLREALQAREDAWDKQLEADVEAGKLEHLREDARRAKKAGTLIDL